MIEYTDKNGKIVKLGDIIKYDENNSSKYGKAVYVIVENKSELAGVLQAGYPYWTLNETPHPIRLAAFCVKPDTIMIDSEVIGNIKKNPEMITVEYAKVLFPDIEVIV